MTPDTSIREGDRVRHVTGDPAIGRAQWDLRESVRHLRREVRALPREDRAQAVDTEDLDEVIAEIMGIFGDLSIDTKTMARERAKREAA